MEGRSRIQPALEQLWIKKLEKANDPDCKLQSEQADEFRGQVWGIRDNEVMYFPFKL